MDRLWLRLAAFALATSIVMQNAAVLADIWDAEPLPVRVVVVTMFEVGEDEGDQPGELQTWVERLPLPESVAFPQGWRDLRLNREMGVLAIVTGEGTARSAASIMALGMDPRFDLGHAYWLVAGIAGVDPADASLGSAAWAEWVVDGSLKHEIDAREIPPDWPTGNIPLDAATPYPQPVPDGDGVVFRLDPDLVAWAYALTREVHLDDTPDLQALRAPYTGHPAAQRPPFVTRGDNVADMTFWYGELLTSWANDWMTYWTSGAGEFVTSAMEDSGTLQALTWLDRAGRVDRDRVLVLRTASNFTMPPPGVTAAEGLAGEANGLSAYLPSLEAAWRVGHPVVETLVKHWRRYDQRMPKPRQSRVSR